MFKSFWRLLKSIGYLLAGKTDKVRLEIDKDPTVIMKKYENMIEKRKDDAQQFEKAMAIGVVELKRDNARLEFLKKEQQRLKNCKDGAAARMKKLFEGELKALKDNPEELKQNTEYQKCFGAFQNFASSLKQTEDEMIMLNDRIAKDRKEVESDDLQLRTIQNEIRDIEKEAAKSVKTIISAKARKEMYDIKTRLSSSGVAKMREEMQDLVARIDAEAEVAGRLAGADAEQQMAEFEKYAVDSEAQTEFDKLIGLGTPEATEEKTASEVIKLPE